MDRRVGHQITYEFDGRATVTEVAKSLTAQEKLFREALFVLEECFPELEVERAEIIVREIVQNSPMRHRLEGIVIAALSPGLTEDMPADIIQLIFGYNVPDSYDSFVSLIMLLVSMWGAERLVKRLKRMKDDGERKRLEAKEEALAEERRRLTNEAANHLSIPTEQLAEALSTVLGKRQVSVSKASMDFLAPARRHNATAITLPSGEGIRQSAISAIPSEVDIAQYQPPVETALYEGVIVSFLRHDKTRPKDWAATIAEISHDRKPLHLAPDIRPDDLFTRESVRADVLVTSVLDNDGDYVPSIYYMTKVYTDGS
ncbi:hypothetical protein [Sphingomonas sp. ID0503]|uniref:hypothetical protein n=1 Tax=Sphingomonas sp. ID0503 TaxID=3399691 RepID=UPI003AFB0CFA